MSKQMKSRHMKFTAVAVCCVLLLVLSALISIQESDAGEKKNFSLYYSFEGNTSAAGKGAADLREMMTLTVKKINERTGINIHLMIEPKWADVYKKLKSGKADLAYIDPFLYAVIKDRGYPVRIAMVGKLGFDFKQCIYVNKSKKIKKISDLKNKSLSAGVSYIARYTDYPSPNEFEYLGQLRKTQGFFYISQLLHDGGIDSLDSNGIDFSIDFANVDSSVIALNRGLIDAAVIDHASMVLNKKGGKDTSNISELACLDDFPPIVIVASKKVPDESLRKFKSALADIMAKPDKEMAGILNNVGLTAGKAGFFPGSDDDFKSLFYLWDTSKKMGWEKGIQAEVIKLIKEKNNKQ